MKVRPHFMPSTKFMSVLRSGIWLLSGRQETSPMAFRDIKRHRFGLQHARAVSARQLRIMRTKLEIVADRRIERRRP